MFGEAPPTTAQRPWSGNIDPAALAAENSFLLRRIGDRQEWVLGVGQVTGRSPFGPGPRIGHWSYGAPGMQDDVVRRHLATDGFAPASWWEPAWMAHFSPGRACFHGDRANVRQALDLYDRLDRPAAPAEIPVASWTCHTDRQRYLLQIVALQQHIHRGDIYEVNHCVRRTTTLPDLDPYAAFTRLLARTDAPFAALYRQGPLFALCMSPERYLRVEGGRVITQPMKGTRKRGASPEQDRALVNELSTDPKERSENIMAVDVARNDLSRIARSGSVRVPELCAVKTYPSVHQLVSTVSAEPRPELDLNDVVRATFPMASMTGAPKRRAMELIDRYEDQGRGLFSGSIGVQLPDGTVDLNVVIRTITYDMRTGLASLITGGAITALSDPEQEWEEMELKARSILHALGHAG